MEGPGFFTISLFLPANTLYPSMHHASTGVSLPLSLYYRHITFTYKGIIKVSHKPCTTATQPLLINERIVPLPHTTYCPDISFIHQDIMEVKFVCYNPCKTGIVE